MTDQGHAPAGSSSGRFFSAAERGSNVEHLLHFVCFSNALQLLIGPPGSGRSRVLRQVRRTADSRWHLCRLDGEEFSEEFDLDSALRKAFARDLVFTEERDAEPLDSALNSRAEQPAPAVRLLLIDNADAMQNSSLARILTLVEKVDAQGNPLLRCILAGDKDLESRITAMASGELALNTVYLPPLTLTEVGDYLRLKLADRGMGGEVELNHSLLDEIWRRSGGIPGAIDAMLGAGFLQASEVAGRPQPARGLPMLHLAAVVFLFGILIVAYFYRGVWHTDAPPPEASTDTTHQNEAVESLPLQREAPLRSGDRESVQQVKPVTGGRWSGSVPDRALDSGEPAAQQPQAGGSIDGSREGSLPAMVAKAEPSAEKPVEAAALTAVVRNLQTGSDRNDPPTDAGSGSADAEAVADPGAATATTSAPAPPLKALSDDETYLLSVPDNHYVIQILAAASSSAVDDFVARQANREQLRIFRTRRPNTYWYVVVVADFADRNAMNKALERLPEEQRKLGAWPRLAGEIKASIRNYRES